jgi:transcriptional repressor NrdR
MRCPYCSHSETKVIDSRETEDLAATRRRRECESCQKRFTTYERPLLAELMVVKKDGRRTLFDRDKIKLGMQKACEKLKISEDIIEKATAEIEQEIRNIDKPEISSEAIGELVMEKLKKIDNVAYIRFASVYREFKDLKSFEKELSTLKKEKR